MVDGWDVGDPIGTGSDIGAPELPYMTYGPKRVESEEERLEREKEEAEEIRIRELENKSNRVSDEAWELYEEGRYHDALIFINRALEYCDWIAGNWNVKGIILDSMKRYEDALVNYDKAIDISPKDVFKYNKAYCLLSYAEFLNDEGNIAEAMEKVRKSIDIFQNIEDKEHADEAWNFKGMLLEKLDYPAEAFICYKMAMEFAGEGNDEKETYRQNRDRMAQFIENKEITCPNCGSKLKITDNFCMKCGTHMDYASYDLKGSDEFTECITMPGEGNLDVTIWNIDEE